MTKRTAPESRECLMCGSTFKPQRSTTVCCGDDCRKVRSKEQSKQKSKRYRERHPEKAKVYAAKYRLEHREACRKRSLDDYYANREKYLAKQAEWRRDNPETARERTARSKARNPETGRRYRKEHAKRLAEKNAAWRSKNRELWNSYSRVRRANLSGQTVSQGKLEARVDYWGRKCWVCGGAYEALDHVKPVSAGGPHLAANIRPICKSCNSRKSARWPTGDWLNDIRDWTMARGIGE